MCTHIYIYSEVIRSKQEFAAKSNERVAEFRKKRRDMINQAKQARDDIVMKQLNDDGRAKGDVIPMPKFEFAYQNIGAYELGSNPRPLNSPYAYSAKDLFKTFADEDSLYI
jgi:hypothetical protein